MGISDRYTYFWTIFSGLPFGVGCFIIGIYFFFHIPADIEGLEKYNGKIADYGVKEVYEKSTDTHRDLFFIQLNKELEFYSDLGKHRKLFIEYFKGKNLIDHKINVWTEKNDQYIEQLSVDGEIVLKYDPPYWMAWTFFIMGILVTTGAIFYLKNNDDDIKAERGLLGRILFGKKKRK
jgi:hypothetical protein